MFGVQKKRGFLRFAAGLLFAAAALFVLSAASLFADGFYTEYFTLTATPVDLAAGRMPIVSPADYLDAAESSPFSVEASDRSSLGDSDDIDFASLAFSDSLTILGQDYGYWSAVQTSPIFVAQSTSGLSARTSSSRVLTSERFLSEPGSGSETFCSNSLR